MKLKSKTTATLLIAIFTISILSMSVMGGVPTNAILGFSGDGSSEWALLGTYRVELDTGDAGGSYGYIKIPIEPVLLSTLTADPSIWVYELTVLSGGKSPNPDPHHPWGHPYINLVLDLDGNPTTVDKDYLEGLGTTAGTVTDGTAVDPASSTWTEMSEGWGYFDGDDSLIGGDFGGLDATAGWRTHSLADWITAMDSVYPNAKIVEVQIMYGAWPAAINVQCSPLYVDDMTIDGVMYNLEPASDVEMSATAMAYIPDKVSISVTPSDVSFGPIDEGSFGTDSVSVDNTGDLAVKVTASLMDEDPADFYTLNLGLGPDLPAVTSVSAWFITGLNPEDSARTVYLQLNIPYSTPAGSKTATLIFWAEEA